MTDAVEKEFLFIDESGDPGLIGNPIYILIGIHVTASALDEMSRHVVAFRYHHDVVREFKAQRWADKLSPAASHLLGFLGDLTATERLTTSANWLDKDTYRAGGGPYLSSPGESWRFRNYQIRRLLERHRQRRPWGAELELVIDRWKMPPAVRTNLEQYLRGNWRLRPVIADLTFVDSAYVDAIQVADIYARLLRRVLRGGATPDEERLAARLMDTCEVRGGLK